MCFLYLIQYTLLFSLFSTGDAVVHHHYKQVVFHRPQFMLREGTTSHSLVPREANTLKPCNEDDLMVYLAEMQAINPESIINLCTQDDFLTMCLQVSDSLDKVDKFLQSCEVINEKDLYVQLIKGVDKFYDYLCNTTSNRDTFQKYFYCIRTLREEYESCAGPADWTEYKDRSLVCEAYQEIVDCYYIKTAKICGINAAKMIKELMKNVINAIIVTTCDVSAVPYVADPMPESEVVESRANMKVPLDDLFVITIIITNNLARR
ncbi:hypothetical protein MML48_5g00001511 [Holotrichia oblita]|uniref:Uncharacterized protein n=1 Tax=Holotrichia oblita TaxID=644536 RepID=A0ACB9T5Q9_HOLOL|nr:hypothetical protein MML48_5g00001511 [Holotrichia oblita]